MKWRVDFPSRIRGKPWLAFDVHADTKEQAKALGYSCLTQNGEHKHHYRQPRATQLKEHAA